MSKPDKWSESGSWLLYDGECPFCSNYINFLRLREVAPDITLIDARQRPEMVLEAKQRGYVIDDGMLLYLNEQVYYGADCIHVLSILGKAGSWLQKINRVVFTSRARARFIYPILKMGRAATLKILGRKGIEND